MKLLVGALAGTFATFPMTAVMKLLHIWPKRQAEPLPPQQVTEGILEPAGLNPESEHGRFAAFAASHLGFGGAAGGLYAAAADKVPGPGPVKGMLFAVMVWLVSYSGWIPMARLLPPAKDQQSERNWMMFLSHLVWGAVLGYAVEKYGAEDKD